MKTLYNIKSIVFLICAIAISYTTNGQTVIFEQGSESVDGITESNGWELSLRFFYAGEYHTINNTQGLYEIDKKSDGSVQFSSPNTPEFEANSVREITNMENKNNLTFTIQYSYLTGNSRVGKLHLSTNGTDWVDMGNMNVNENISTIQVDNSVGYKYIKVSFTSTGTSRVRFYNLKVTSNTPTGIESNQAQFSVFSNSNNTVNVQSNATGKYNLTAYSLGGKQVYNKTTTGNSQHQLGHLPKGLYIVKLNNKQETFTQKIVVQ